MGSASTLAPDHPALLRRKLHLGHFAFMRAYVEGLPLDEI